MNLLARILSHGFAFAVVALIIIVLMYRGDLFEEADLPDFLVINKQTGTVAGSGTGSVDRGAAGTTAQAPAVLEAPAPVEESPVSTMHEEIAGATETVMPATGSMDEADTAVTEVTETETVGASTGEPAVAAPETVTDTTAPAYARPASEPEPARDEAAAAEPAAETPPEVASAPEQEAESAAIEPPAESSETTEAASPIAATDVPGPEETAPAVAEETPPVAVETTAAPVVAEEAPAVPEEVAISAPGEVTEPRQESASPSPYAVMAKAREAYWLRDFDAAEQQYRLLTQIDPDNPDSYGEMGNMYFSQGKWDEAAAAYYEAGTRLVDEGLIVQAKQILEVIRGLNGSRADELEAQINAASTP